MSNTTCVVHLVWAPLGSEPVRRFAEACRQHPAGAAHELLVVYNGFDGASDGRLPASEAAFDDCPRERLLLERPMLDLAAYRVAAEHVTAARLCFVNSYSRPLAAGWLTLLEAALAAPGTGLVGACGTWESAYNAAPPWLKPFRSGWPRFPNPHLRTNGFMIERELLLSLDWPEVDSKGAAWELESGRASISRQVLERGRRLRVVGRDGGSFESAEWPASRTFRIGEQDNLLIADNRTEEYAHAGPRRRRVLRRLAWGGACMSA